ncbi:MAG: hypothetical protein ACREJX_03530 [Polyangiaceae bacterium]
MKRLIATFREALNSSARSTFVIVVSRGAPILFGISSVLFGVVALISHDSTLWERCVAIAAVAGGAGMLLPRAVRAASILLGIVYLLFAIENVPGMLATPANAVLYVNFFEMFSLACGAMAVLGSGKIRRVARVGMGICAFSFAWAQLVYFQYTASLVPGWIPPSGAFWTILTTIAFALAALAILINRRARLAGLLMALMIALFGVLVWVPRIVAQPQTLSNWNEIASNYLMAAAVWLVAEIST